MANLSQQKRQRMLEFLQTIREEHKDDDDVLIAIGEIESELNAKKYGLVWEQHEEAVDVQMRDNIPVFTECADKEIFAAPGEKFNFLLEGDNLHSLRLLEKTHLGKIDLIYIDPPYNTGNQDFRYDDVYVDELDTYRHSKWLSFMSERLRIAAKLLAPHGFIFISIDDKEAAQLKLLCDEIFGDANYEKTDYIQVRYPDKTLKSDMKYHKEIEQVLVYRKSDSATPYLQPQEYDYEKFVYSVNELAPGIEIQLGGKKVVVFQKGEWELVKHKEGFKEGLKEIWATGTILNGNSSGRFFRDYLDGRKEKDGLGVLYKVYGVGDDSFDYRYFSGPQKVTATKGKYYQGVPVDKMEEGSTKVSPIPNFYDMAGDFGNIRHEGGIPFNSGKKPIKLMSMFLNYFKQKDITVLDFFAGSASTAHAVLALNQADGGTRKFIICTNDENDICTEVTYPRISNVINGYANTKGIPANLKYYRTDFVPKDAEEVSEELLSHIAEMVQLENGVKLDGREYILVMSDDEADVLEQHWSEYTDVKALYVSKNVLFTTKQNALFKNVEIHTIPDYYFKFEMQEVGEAWYVMQEISLTLALREILMFLKCRNVLLSVKSVLTTQIIYQSNLILHLSRKPTWSPAFLFSKNFKRR